MKERYFINNIGEFNYEIDIDLADKCIEEVNSLKCDKISFMNSKIEERLNKCNNTFLDDFNSGIDEIIHMIDEDSYSNKEYIKLMKKITKATSTSERSLLLILKELAIIKEARKDVK